jgi:cytochrome c oxidase cbb3-type subunit 1
VRMAGGGIFASGMLLMALNTWLTVRRRRDERAPQASPLLAS